MCVTLGQRLQCINFLPKPCSEQSRNPELTHMIDYIRSQYGEKERMPQGTHAHNHQHTY